MEDASCMPHHSRYLPIHKAASKGHLMIVKELVAGGSPVRPQNNEGCAPLHYAARGGHLSTVQYLLAARVSAGAYLHCALPVVWM